MRVLHVITKLDRGGAQHHVRDTALAARSAGDEVVVACGEWGPTADALVAAGIEVVALPHLRHRPGPIVDHLATGEIQALIHRVRPALVCCHSSKAGLLCRLAAAREGVAAAYTAHGWPFMFGSPWHRAASLAAEVVAGRFLPAEVICVSEADFAIGRRFVPAGRLRLERNAIPDDHRRADPGADVAEPHIVMVARMAPPKDHGAALRVLDAIRDLTWRATFVGGGPLLPRWQVLAADLGLGDRVLFAGDLDDPVEVLVTANVQMHLSGYEGMPLAVLEGMRAGLPVVCSGWRGLAELVGHGLATDDPTVRAAILRRLLDDPGLRRSLGDAARARFLDVHLRGSVHPVGHTPAGQ